jgi:ribosomal protein S18 acetylase RimI-like enzyme
MDVGTRTGFRELSQAEIEPAVSLLARGMCDNPILIKTFGADKKRRERRLERYYALVVPLILRKGGFLGAFGGEKLLGLVGTLPPGCCQANFLDVLQFVPTLVTYNSLMGALRVKRWQDAWARHDPRENHWHVGLVTVDSHLQGRGIGTQLMFEHCAQMDQRGATSYLETDKAINVRFYQKFGFQIVGQEPVLGTTNWFMKRPARTDRSAFTEGQIPLPSTAAF